MSTRNDEEAYIEARGFFVHACAFKPLQTLVFEGSTKKHITDKHSTAYRNPVLIAQPSPFYSLYLSSH